uniref:Ionotropic glutamate receptor C-terminal domain-containing protein n=1 Tax=Glossina palpalis gambiensis TaxID=67801 RepID=A0A1B0ATM2_9MUSC
MNIVTHCLLFVQLFSFVCYSNQLQQLNIGAFFYENEFEYQRAFESAVLRINSENKSNFKLLPMIKKLSSYDGPIALKREDIVNSFGWKKFTIVYDAEDVYAYTKLQDLFQLHSLHSDIVRIRKFKRNEDYRILWKSIKGERRIVLDCNPNILLDLLKAAVPFDLTGQFNHLFLTNLDTHSSEIKSLRDNPAYAMNVTAVRLKLNDGFYKHSIAHKRAIANIKFHRQHLKVTLIHDALMLYGIALKNIATNYPTTQRYVNCDYNEYNSTYSSPAGSYIYNSMTNISPLDEVHFRSGSMLFDDNGQRTGFEIEMYEPLNDYGTAFWNTKGQITQQHIGANVLKKIVYRVATRIGEPLTAKTENVTHNRRYMGYAVDLIEALSKEIGFEYIFVPVADNGYGKYNKETKQWNGIIGELINNDAHMGICDLTITQARKTVVDFTVPFMQLGISILAYQKPTESKAWSAFLDPFTVDVWIYVMISIFIIALLFIFMARISRDEWENPHPCNKDPICLENKWNISNSFWLTMGSIMTAGSDILPCSASMRTFNAMWWIFAVIIANSYTANLAAFLTNSKMEGSISGIQDLAEQTKVKFGTMEGGSTFTFFSESNETTYRLAYNLMQNNDPPAYTKDNKEGVDRVLKNNGSYMFLMETTSLEYNTERNCKLKMLGEKFGEKHYAIAVPFGAEYRSNLSVAILKLSERGELFQLKNKWWKNHNNTCHEGVQTDASETPDMTFSEVRGIFYTLGVGVIIAYTVGIFEFLIYTQKVAAAEKLTFKKAFLKEIIFVLCVWNNKKPLKLASSNSSKTTSPNAP